MVGGGEGSPEGSMGMSLSHQSRSNIHMHLNQRYVGNSVRWQNCSCETLHAKQFMQNPDPSLLPSSSRKWIAGMYTVHSPSPVSQSNQIIQSPPFSSPPSVPAPLSAVSSAPHSRSHRWYRHRTPDSPHHCPNRSPVPLVEDSSRE